LTVRALWLGLALLSLATALQAQTLYKYLDKDGKVVYSDHPPKGVEATRVDTDQNANVIKGPQRPVETGKSRTSPEVGVRIALREKLRAKIVAAEARVAEAKQALEDGLAPRDDEWQPTLSRPDNGGKADASGKITGRGGRVACTKSKGADGVERVICPALMVPSEGYHDRVKNLEEALERAEAALVAAQNEYRRNAPD
jgi:hypothetical protein